MSDWPAGVGRVVLDAVDSTNDEARRRTTAGEQGPVWVAARRQLAGRAPETTEAVGTLIRAGMAVAIDTEPGTVRADRLRLRQVFRNLLSNAQKYGGPNIRVEGRIEGATYLWSVIDDGAGVSEAILGRLFRPFIHRGEDVAVTDSVGLGLSIVHALVHGMGGGVTHSRIDDETHFTVRLPLSSSAADTNLGPVAQPEPALAAKRQGLP